MWQIDNQTPFAAQRAGTRDRQGRELWQVAVKASYRFDPAGRVRVAEQQAPVHLAGVYRDPDKDSSLRHESDFALEKAGSDILLDASAWAPAGRAVTSLEVGFALGPLIKRLRVTGQRHWRRGAFSMVADKPQPFERMPLIWENAYGGKDGVNPATGFAIAYPANPVGKGYYTHRAHALDQPLPTVEYPDRPLRRCTRPVPPAGFGPIARHWLPRSRHAGSYDQRWQQTRAPLPPEDLSPLYYQCAPEDQQLQGFLSGGEAVRLRHLTAEGEVAFTLPEPDLRFTTRFEGRPPRSHPGRITALIIEPDDYRFSLLIQTDLPCQGEEDALIATRIEQGT